MFTLSMISFLFFFFFFFFSSRRRHTRCLSDWSSDVCSSDLMNLLSDCVAIWIKDSYSLQNPGFALVPERIVSLRRELTAKPSGSGQNQQIHDCRTPDLPPLLHFRHRSLSHLGNASDGGVFRQPRSCP